MTGDQADRVPADSAVAARSASPRVTLAADQRRVADRDDDEDRRDDGRRMERHVSRFLAREGSDAPRSSLFAAARTRHRAEVRQRIVRMADGGAGNPPSARLGAESPKKHGALQSFVKR